MPYPYGTQNAPVVGNGLGGLPRRATVTVSTAKQYPVKLQAVGNTITYSGSTSAPTLLSQPISTGARTGALLFRANTTAQYGAPKGFSFDVNVGMLSWATNGTQGTSSNELMSGQAFAGGMAYFDSTGTAGAIYVATTNGTDTFVTTLTTVPSSGTLSGGESYSSLTVVKGMNSDDGRYPRCFDAYGNMVILYRATISAASWLCAFVINAGGTIINSRKLFVLDSTGASYNSSDFWIIRSGIGFVIAANYRDTTSRMNIWNANSDFTTVTAIGPSSTYTMPSGGAPQTSTFNNSSTTVAISAYTSDGIGKIWGAALNTNGAAIEHSSTPALVTINAYSSLHQYGLPAFFDPANNFYYGSSQSTTGFPTSNNSASDMQMGVAYGVGAAMGDSNMAVVLQQPIAAASTDSNPNGISGSTIGYLGNGYWACVWSVQTINTLNARLFKEV